ncbi:MAG: hypothetical protein U0941_23955 [Planctomycetaceae bacterium]
MTDPFIPANFKMASCRRNWNFDFNIDKRNSSVVALFLILWDVIHNTPYSFPSHDVRVDPATFDGPPLI